MNDEHLRNEDALFRDLYNQSNVSKEKRNKLIDKLMITASEMDINPREDKPSLIEAKLGIINTIDGLLKGNESSSAVVINTALKRKDVDNNGNIAANVASLLKTIKQTDTVPNSPLPNSPNNLDEKIESNFNESERPISEEELSEVSETSQTTISENEE